MGKSIGKIKKTFEEAPCKVIKPDGTEYIMERKDIDFSLSKMRLPVGERDGKS